MADCPLADDCPEFSERISGMGCQHYGDRGGKEWCNHYSQPIEDLKTQPVKSGEEIVIDVVDMVYLMDAAEAGYVSPAELQAVYVENLERVLEHVERLVERLDGKTVITADHGELLGETTNLYSRLTGDRYEHPGYVWTPELRLVPWLVVPWENRRDIVAERPVERDDVDDEVVEEHLRALGYQS